MRTSDEVMLMLFDAPYPLRLTRSGRWLLAMWATTQGVLFVLLLTAWLR